MGNQQSHPTPFAQTIASPIASPTATTPTTTPAIASPAPISSIATSGSGSVPLQTNSLNMQPPVSHAAIAPLMVNISIIDKNCLNNDLQSKGPVSMDMVINSAIKCQTISMETALEGFSVSDSDYYTNLIIFFIIFIFTYYLYL